MAHDVFISYSSQDKTITDAVCATLEGRKIRCWIAPRDVPPGLPYATALVNAINDYKVFVLVLSKGSNTSGQVLREVEEAVDNGTPIIPLRIEDFEPTDAMRYYIKSIHWLDAMSPPLERHLGKLADSVQVLLSVSAEEQPPPVVETVSVMEAPAKKRQSLPTWATAGLVIAAVVIVGGVGLLAVSQLRLAPSTTSTPPLTTESSDRSSPESTSSLVWSEWQTPSFRIPNETLWTETMDGTYRATGSEDTFLWSEEIVEGDLILSLDLDFGQTNPGGNVVVYGEGFGWSKGSLIFTIENDFQMIATNTLYEGYDQLVINSDELDPQDRPYSITIEIIGSVSSLSVDGNKVASANINWPGFGYMIN